MQFPYICSYTLIYQNVIILCITHPLFHLLVFEPTLIQQITLASQNIVCMEYLKRFEHEIKIWNSQSVDGV